MKKPKLRFPEFTDDWKQYKFGDIFTVSQGLQIPIDKRFLEDGENRFFYITNEFLKDTCSTAYYIENPSPSVLCNNEDILMTRTGNTGIVVTNVSGCFHNNFFKIKYDNHNFSKNYIYYLLNTKRMQNTILKNAGSSTIPDLSHKSFYQIIGYFPKQLMEQEKIGSLLLNVDNLIQSAEKELEGYRELKQGMLQKMFPKKGEKVPEIRFPEFNGDWEQRKLEDIANRFDNLRVPVASSLRIKGTTPYYGANGIQDYVDGFTHEGEYVLVAEDGANDLINYPVNYVNGRIWVNNHAHVLQGKDNVVNNRYLSYAISRINMQSVLVGGGRAKLNAEAMMNLNLFLPSIAEQKKIGEYFSNLDNLITLQQKEIDSYKELKKGLLQQMFC
ncbi:restriction endonuclease subunit S [Holdemanella porci]|uniref:restriction endonuclease subunit S n=1 Tax=Holdemanella porci TaxID=2652276 RepID=UPI003FD7DD11